MMLNISLMRIILPPKPYLQPVQVATSTIKNKQRPFRRETLLEVPLIDTSSIKTLKELEYEAIVAGLERTNWNMTTTAQQLGISRMTLYRKLDQHGLRKKD